MKFAHMSWRIARFLILCLQCPILFFGFGINLSNAAEHFIDPTASTVDCATYGAKPGDTFILASGTRGPLRIRNCSGTSESPITIRNDPNGNSPTVISRSIASSGGFIFTCSSCVNVVIDGTGRWNGAPQDSYCGAPSGRDGCGIKVTTFASDDHPAAYMKLNGMTTAVTVRGVEIDGRMSDLKSTGIGIDPNDHSMKSADHPDFWRENLTFEHNYVHDVGNSAMYIGPNWREGDLGIPLRDITIRSNLMENTGRDGVKLKSAIEGTNRIHHNVIRNTGLRNEGTNFGAGIVIFEGGGDAKIHHNWVEGAGVQGIQHFNMNIPESRGTFRSEIFNNVIYDAGKIAGQESNGHGITVANAEGSAGIVTAVYNNTIVKTSHAGINFGARIEGSVARDNIVAESGGTALSLSGNTSANNRAGSIASMGFLSPLQLDFALNESSPARDAGSATGFPDNDFRGVPRPQGSGPDQGAFEFSSTGAAPIAPKILEVD